MYIRNYGCYLNKNILIVVPRSEFIIQFDYFTSWEKEELVTTLAE
jgi:hypothetical protein